MLKTKTLGLLGIAVAIGSIACARTVAQETVAKSGIQLRYIGGNRTIELYTDDRGHCFAAWGSGGVQASALAVYECNGDQTH